MGRTTEQRLIEPSTAEDRAALACLLRLRSEGRPVAEIAAGLLAETGTELAPAAADGCCGRWRGRRSTRKVAVRSTSVVILAKGDGD